jgi:hypothetical protein
LKIVIAPFSLVELLCEVLNKKGVKNRCTKLFTGIEQSRRWRALAMYTPNAACRTVRIALPNEREARRDSVRVPDTVPGDRLPFRLRIDKPKVGDRDRLNFDRHAQLQAAPSKLQDSLKPWLARYFGAHKASQAIDVAGR